MGKVGLNKKVFVFLLMEATFDSFPPELTTNYTVSKVLEKAACGEGQAVLQGARRALGCHEDHLQARNQLQRRQQVLQCAEHGRGVNPADLVPCTF